MLASGMTSLPRINFRKEGMTADARLASYNTVNTWLVNPSVSLPKRNVLKAALKYIDDKNLVNVGWLNQTKAERWQTCENIFNAINLSNIDFLNRVIAVLSAIPATESSSLKKNVLAVACYERKILIDIEAQKIQRIAFGLAGLAIIALFAEHNIKGIATILLAVGMWVLSHELVEWRLAQAQIRRAAQARGIDTERLAFIADGMDEGATQLERLSAAASNAFYRATDRLLGSLEGGAAPRRITDAAPTAAQPQ